MSRITRTEVERIAHLARLELEPGELDLFVQQFEDILAFVDRLGEIDLEGVEPFRNAAAEGNVLRADETGASLPRAEALANAPERDEGFFRVPDVIA